MHPDKIIFLNQRRDAFGKPLINPLIALPGALFILGKIDAIVKQRPQGRVGIAIVIFINLALSEVNCRGCDAAASIKMDVIGRFCIFLPRPAKPQPPFVL